MNASNHYSFFKVNFVKLVVFLLLIICAFLLISCQSIESVVSSSVSEYRENYYYAQKDNFKVSFTDGRREENFVMDGHSTKLVDYGVVVVKTSEDLGQNPAFVLTIDGREYAGNLEINPFDLTYVADIQNVAGRDKNITFSIPSIGFSISLECLSSSWAVTCSRALDIFTQGKKAEITSFFRSPAEVYVKIVASHADENDIFFYILCVNESGETLSGLIDVHTGTLVMAGS